MKLATEMRGLGEPAFRARFGTEEQCLAVLFEMRWGRGFICERCGFEKYSRMKTRKHVQCNACKHQTGFTAGTVFHSTKLPLTTWFRAIYELTQAEGRISSIELAKRLGVRQPTAWLMKKKVMSAMEKGEVGQPKTTGRVQRGGTDPSGVRRGGKRGRGAAGEILVRCGGRDDPRSPDDGRDAASRDGSAQDRLRDTRPIPPRRRQQRRR